LEIGGVLTSKCKIGRYLSKNPQDRLLLETDGPYLTPHPIGGKRHEPGIL